MEVRVVIIPDSGQTSVTEFKTEEEAADFLIHRVHPELRKDELNEEVIYPVDEEIIPEQKKGFVERMFN